jgi:tRNA pseudouridine38-40 synthase
MGARTKLLVAYLGGGFSGWQRQRRGRTVQGELEAALTRVTGGRPAAVVGAGRTDAGVHAAGQVAHVDLPVPVPPPVLPRLLNARLPPDVRIRSAVAAPRRFHARTSALGKLYVYRARWRAPELPWVEPLAATVAPVDRPGDLEAACRLLVGRHDWSSFTVPEVALRGAVRTVSRVEVRWRRHGLEVHVVGEGFLRYQVRRMVAALLEVGRGRMAMGDLEGLLARPAPGSPLPTAPPSGLCLERVYYRDSPRLHGPDPAP